jgi:hypothetical protein
MCVMKVTAYKLTYTHIIGTEYATNKRRWKGTLEASVLQDVYEYYLSIHLQYKICKPIFGIEVD